MYPFTLRTNLPGETSATYYTNTMPYSLLPSSEPSVSEAATDLTIATNEDADRIVILEDEEDVAAQKNQKTWDDLTFLGLEGYGLTRLGFTGRHWYNQVIGRDVDLYAGDSDTPLPDLSVQAFLPSIGAEGLTNSQKWILGATYMADNSLDMWADLSAKFNPVHSRKIPGLLAMEGAVTDSLSDRATMSNLYMSLASKPEGGPQWLYPASAALRILGDNLVSANPVKPYNPCEGGDQAAGVCGTPRAHMLTQPAQMAEQADFWVRNGVEASAYMVWHKGVQNRKTGELTPGNYGSIPTFPIINLATRASVDGNFGGKEDFNYAVYGIRVGRDLFLDVGGMFVARASDDFVNAKRYSTTWPAVVSAPATGVILKMAMGSEDAGSVDNALFAGGVGLNAYVHFLTFTTATHASLDYRHTDWDERVPHWIFAGGTLVYTEVDMASRGVKPAGGINWPDLFDPTKNVKLDFGRDVVLDPKVSGPISAGLGSLWGYVDERHLHLGDRVASLASPGPEEDRIYNPDNPNYHGQVQGLAVAPMMGIGNSMASVPMALQPVSSDTLANDPYDPRTISRAGLNEELASANQGDGYDINSRHLPSATIGIQVQGSF